MRYVAIYSDEFMNFIVIIYLNSVYTELGISNARSVGCLLAW